MIETFSAYFRNELNRSALTVEAYRHDIEGFLAYLTAGKLSDINYADIRMNDIRDWLGSLAHEKESPRTLRRKLQSLRAFFRFLQKRNMIAENPAADIPMPKVSKPLPELIKHEELEEIIADSYHNLGDPEAHHKQFRDILIVETLYTLGLRRAELVNINDKDLSLYGNELKVTGKRSKQRLVPVPKSLMEKLQRWQDIRNRLFDIKTDNPPLFISRGKRMNADSVYRAVKKILGESSARKKSPHALRHSFASGMLNNGADLNSVKEFLGHASLATTQIYTHISFAEIKNAYRSSHPRAKKSQQQ